MIRYLHFRTLEFPLIFFLSLSLSPSSLLLPSPAWLLFTKVWALANRLLHLLRHFCTFYVVFATFLCWFDSCFHGYVTVKNLIEWQTQARNIHMFVWSYPSDFFWSCFFFYADCWYISFDPAQFWFVSCGARKCWATTRFSIQMRSGAEVSLDTIASPVAVIPTTWRIVVACKVCLGMTWILVGWCTNANPYKLGFIIVTIIIFIYFHYNCGTVPCCTCRHSIFWQPRWLQCAQK